MLLQLLSLSKINELGLQKFQKMYETEEAEAEVEKKQLALLHQQRVQAELDDRKRRMLDNYIEAIENDYDDEDEADVCTVVYDIIYKNGLDFSKFLLF